MCCNSGKLHKDCAYVYRASLIKNDHSEMNSNCLFEQKFGYKHSDEHCLPVKRSILGMLNRLKTGGLNNASPNWT